MKSNKELAAEIVIAYLNSTQILPSNNTHGITKLSNIEEVNEALKSVYDTLGALPPVNMRKSEE